MAELGKSSGQARAGRCGPGTEKHIRTVQRGAKLIETREPKLKEAEEKVLRRSRWTRDGNALSGVLLF